MSLRQLPNAISIARMLLVIPIAWAVGAARLNEALILCAIAAFSDALDGYLAKRFDWTSELGKLLDPLADKLLLIGTFVPMWALMQSANGAFAGPSFNTSDLSPRALPFVTPWGDVSLPWWIIAIVLGRELAMTIFRQAAARRGVVIAAIGPAKFKTGFQLVWQGAAYFWFVVATMALTREWNGAGWHGLAMFIGTAGTIVMSVAVVLTLYSLWLYVSRYGRVFVQSRARS